VSKAPAPPLSPHPALTPEALAALYDHARQEHPRECCGLVFGPKDAPVASRARACANLQDALHAEDPAANPRDAHTAYSLGSSDLFALSQSLRGGEPAKIIYHSHIDRPGDGAYFSDTDQRVATVEGEPWYPAVEYVVVDVKSDGVHGAAQYAWSDEAKKFVEVGRYAP
jgi:proteasome lid subunit RPN8/RPN11